MLAYDDLYDPDVTVNERGLSALRFGGLRWLVRRLDAGGIIRTVVSAFRQALLDLVWQGLQFYVNIFPGVAWFRDPLCLKRQFRKAGAGGVRYGPLIRRKYPCEGCTSLLSLVSLCTCCRQLVAT
jgi:hypothetical protein